MKELHLNIVSPEKEVFDGEVKSVTFREPAEYFPFWRSMRRLSLLCKKEQSVTRQRMAKNIRWIFTAVLWS